MCVLLCFFPIWIERVDPWCCNKRWHDKMTVCGLFSQGRGNDATGCRAGWRRVANSALQTRGCFGKDQRRLILAFYDRPMAWIMIPFWACMRFSASSQTIDAAAQVIDD